jgi:hypothetical protein
MAAEDGLERLIVAAAGQALQPPAEPADAPDEPDDREPEGQDDDEQPADDRPDVGGDERVEIDRTSSTGRVGRV